MSLTTSHTKWTGYDVFGEQKVQWVYYDSVDGVRRYEHRTGFVLKENAATKTLLRVPENPRYFYRHFSCTAYNKQSELVWLGF